MNFKDLQFNIGKLTTNVKSQVAKNNPMQNQDTRSLNLWLFEERNDLSFMKTTAYHHAETNKAFLEWIKDELVKNKQHANYSEDIEDIGSTLSKLLDKQVELEKQYTERYRLYRRAIKSMREKEVELADLREKKQTIQERIHHLSKSNPTSKKIPELERELAQLDTSAKETEDQEYKRFIMKEAFHLRFNALQEYAEKTAIIAGYGKYIVDLLDAENHASSNCDMILQDALLTVDGWKPKDERTTLTEVGALFRHEDEDDEDALLLTSDETQLRTAGQQQKQQQQQQQGTGKAAATNSPLEANTADKNRDPKPIPTTDNQGNASDHCQATDYYHRLYQEEKSKQKKQQPIQHARSYAEFQNQFDIPSSGKREYFAELPPPAYSDNADRILTDNDAKK